MGPEMGSIKITAPVKSALGIAIAVLEELSDPLRPNSNIDDMKTILNVRTTGSVGRDNLIVAHAVAAGLAMRAIHAIDHPIDLSKDMAGTVLTSRVSDFMSLFAAAADCAPGDLAIKFAEVPVQISKAAR
jgi:hypothetical protein